MRVSAVRNKLIFVLSMVFMGALAGGVVWLFLFVMDFGIALLWEWLPSYFDFALFPLAACAIGGIVIGLFRKRFGDYPETLDTVLGKVKKNNRYEYDNLAVYSIGALLPLAFGGSIGPEAGLTGTIAGLCTWVGDRMKRFGSDFKYMTEIGVSAALSAIFTAPLFGFAAPMLGSTGRQDDDDGAFTLPIAKKAIVYLCAIAGALAVFLFLKELVGGSGGLPHFSEIAFGPTEFIWTAPLIAAGAAAGWAYHVFDFASIAVNRKLGDRPVTKALIGGILLALAGIALPYTMFAGESQATELFRSRAGVGTAVLFLTGFLKLFITSYCIHSGWRGGHFFPAIFSGISIGLGFAAISGADPVFCMCACAGALVGCLTRQPILTVLLLFLCFPLKGVVVMIVAAAIGSAVPIPGKIQQHLD